MLTWCMNPTEYNNVMFMVLRGAVNKRPTYCTKTSSLGYELAKN